MAKATFKKKTTILTDESMNFFRKYINNASPVGFETWGQKLWLEYLKPYVDDHYVDPYGTAVGIVNPKHDFKVVIEAHADEISWFVNYINLTGVDLFKKKWRRRSPDRAGTTGIDTWKKRAGKSSVWMASDPYKATVI